ncbi:MAG: DsrE/DsrF/DrsH-like family protein [Chloroflexi bacterium]|nr:DsrE/DsrF/DrsH-like family protein [Chloroflexota bacterium]
MASIDEETFEKLHRAAHQREKKRLAIIASKGTLDMAYPPLILATTAAAMDMEVTIFFTFYGLDIINKKKLASLQVPSLANPAMPIPVPNILGALPGMTAMATAMLKGMMAKQNMPTIAQLLDIARQSGVRLVACTTTMGVMGVREEDLLPGVELEGAAAFLDYAADGHVSVFV